MYMVLTTTSTTSRTDSASKAASNLLTLKLALALKPEAFTVVAVHPGCKSPFPAS